MKPDMLTLQRQIGNISLTLSTDPCIFRSQFDSTCNLQLVAYCNQYFAVMRKGDLEEKI